VKPFRAMAMHPRRVDERIVNGIRHHLLIDEEETTILNHVKSRHAIDSTITVSRRSDRAADFLLVKRRSVTSNALTAPALVVRGEASQSNPRHGPHRINFCQSLASRGEQAVSILRQYSQPAGGYAA
jgi:hypothetical protein